MLGHLHPDVKTSTTTTFSVEPASQPVKPITYKHTHFISGIFTHTTDQEVTINWYFMQIVLLRYILESRDNINIPAQYF
jgi:hypothetical protein